MSKIWVYLAKLSPFLAILENDVSFVWMVSVSAHVFMALFALWLAEKSRVIFLHDLITSVSPRLASDASLPFEFSLVHFFYFLTLNNRLIYKVKPSS